MSLLLSLPSRLCPRQGGFAGFVAGLWLAAAVALLGAVPGSLPVAAAAEARAAAPGTFFRDCPDCPEMVVLPPGTFVLGTPGEAVPGSLVVKVPHAFALGRREVTRGEYAKFIAEAAYEPKSGCRSLDVAVARYRQDRTRSWQNPLVPALPEDSHPVSCVSFADAQAYTQWLARKTGKAYRLPSEGEWEYAARAGSTTLRPWGDEAALGCAEANGYDLVAEEVLHLGQVPVPCRDGFSDVAPVGRFHANAFGLQDLLGNVAEWTLDCVTDSYTGRAEDVRPWVWVGGCTQHVVRGGAWNSPPVALRSAARSGMEANERTDALGFRVAQGLDK